MDVCTCSVNLSLATLRSSSESSGEAGIILHDLQLEFCQQEAAKENKLSVWHAQLLKWGMWKPPMRYEQKNQMHVRRMRF